MNVQKLRRWFAWMSVVALLLSSSAAIAQQGPDRAKLARQHFDRGAQSFYKGDYANALLEFRKAYQYKEDATILYNMSLAYLKLDNLDGALEAAQRAKAKGGMPKKMQVRNDARIRGLGVAMSAVKVAGGIAEQKGRIAQDEQEQAHQEQTQQQPPKEASTQAQPPEHGPGAAPNAQADQGLGALGWTGVSMSVVGAGLLAYAVVVDQQLGSDIDAYKASDAANYDDYRQTISDKQTVGQIAMYSGAGLAAAGLTLWIVDVAGGDETTQDSMALEVSPGVDRQMVRLRWSF